LTGTEPAQGGNGLEDPSPSEMESARLVWQE